MSIADYNGDVVKYIEAFRLVDARLQGLGYPLPKWFVTDTFISGLGDHDWDFIQLQEDKTRDRSNKGKIDELDLTVIMGLLIAHAQYSYTRGR